ncbi:MAG: hypothetical protein AVDCRST_MAG38-836 [uncultured Solirubrobacteraceae bacterium]|uniref:Uncharacterized protein n=1 Tax=uncultured Solirubrobacteraceae bacterium TaxID=1162706 RepID=A0A6J4R7V0_9ACTN|nr:MAG: hypothetical protein AVDCRST_MAG38-836 [uncultured Solirubrobacteraceae bacterium]
MTTLELELRAAGGAAAPAAATARLRVLLLQALQASRGELDKPRSGYETPVTVAMAGADGHLLAVGPVPAALRADTAAVNERSWLLVAATVASLVLLAGAARPRGAGELCLRAGIFGDDHLVLAMPVPEIDPSDLDELVPLAFAEHAEGIDRLRARALAVPGMLLDGIAAQARPPIGDAHPLRIAEAVARLGGRPARPASVAELEDEVLSLLAAGGGGAVRPHEDPDPARKIARRILQRLDGMGKWGGYHTEFAHLPRGFAGNQRALAQDVGEALLAAGLLAEKPSVGQRHVFLNPRRAAEIRALIERGEEPAGLRLPEA